MTKRKSAVPVLTIECDGHGELFLHQAGKLIAKRRNTPNAQWISVKPGFAVHDDGYEIVVREEVRYDQAS